MEVLSLYFTCILTVVKKRLAPQKLPTNIQKDIDKILDPRVLLEAGFNIDRALYRAIIKHVCEEREDNVTLTSLYPPLFPQTWRNAQIMLRARHKIYDFWYVEHPDIKLTADEVYIYYFCLNLVVYKEWKCWHGSYVEYHDLRVPWQILDPASKPLDPNVGDITKMYKDFEYICNPRKYLWMHPRLKPLPTNTLQAEAPEPPWN